jgi:hypothetical protein
LIGATPVRTNASRRAGNAAIGVATRQRANSIVGLKSLARSKVTTVRS